MNEKRQIIKIPSDTLFPIIEECFRNGQEVSLCVRGNSMFPLLRDDVDSLKLTAAAFDRIQKRDIVLIRRDNGDYILHRVCKKTPDAFYMVGDNQQDIEGPLRPDQLIAVTEEVYRGKHVIRRGSFIWNFYAQIWLTFRPFRMLVLAALIKANSIVRHRGK